MTKHWRTPKYDNYLRQCKRCNEIYRTDKRTSRVCPNCSMAAGTKKKVLKTLNE